MRTLRVLGATAVVLLSLALLSLTEAAFAETAAEHRVLTFSLVHGVVHNAADTVKVRQGDELELRWSSDQPMQLHLHGYNIEVRVSPQAPAVMAFKANLPGRFPVEPHGPGPAAHHPVLYLEVYP
ncbi:MAG TPA: hypothetical protein VH278_08470 [Burkholderiaceae bacterium]|nr:hypothetical protein [Burkholderiaceae bacterium]